MKIYKYQLAICNRQNVAMPVNAEVLAFQMQKDIPTIWAKIPDKAGEIKDRIFSVVGTGHLFDDSDCKYIGTAQDHEFVWHLFEKN